MYRAKLWLNKPKPTSTKAVSMNQKIKQQLIDYLYDVYVDSMFDKHGKRDIILYGSSFKGLNNMTDEELVDDYETIVDEDDELLAEARAELAINGILAT